MKYFVRALFLVALSSLAVSFVQAEPRQLIQGTQIHIKLLGDIGTATSRNGDPFLAVIAQPLTVGDQVILPAGTRIRGIVTSISRAKRFALFRGEASEEGEGRRRKDVDVTEGQMLQQKHDVKGDIVAGTIGTGGATLIGKLASNAAAGFGIGLAGSAIYVSARKGKELNLPAETGMVVRMDSTVTVPAPANAASGATNGQ